MSATPRNALEQSVFAAGLLVVSAFVCYLAYAAIHGDDRPPRLTVVLGQPYDQEGSIVVPLSVTNAGDVTAKLVVVQVQRGSESAEATIEFVPRGSTRGAWVTFEGTTAGTDPLRARVTGYEQP